MDLQRIFLFLIFAFSLVLVWDGWQRHEHPNQQIHESGTVNKELPKSQSVLPVESAAARFVRAGSRIMQV